MTQTLHFEWPSFSHLGHSRPVARFAFELPRQRKDATQQQIQSALPSSLDNRSSWEVDLFRSEPHVTALVLYELTAQVAHSGIVIAKIVEPISIYDSSNPRPPTYVHDFGTEYVCHKDTVLGWPFLTKFGVLSISSAEPRHFAFCKSEEQAATALRLQLTFRRSGKLRGSPLPFMLGAEVVWRLKSSTFVSVKDNKSLPTVEEASRSLSVGKIISHGRRQRMKIDWFSWHQSTQKTATEEEVWTTKQHLWLAIPRSCSPPPTFSTNDLSRRYSIALRLRVRGIGGGKVYLDVPVQIVYQKSTSSEVRSSGHFASSTDYVSRRVGSQDAFSVSSVDLPMYKP